VRPGLRYERRVVIALAATLASAWHAAPQLRTPRAAHAVATATDAIWVVGGSGGQLGVERFDGQRWTVATQLPHGGLNAPAAAVAGGRLYVLGGVEEQTNLPTDAVEVYDPRTHAWSSAAPLPSPRGGHAAVVLNGKIHVLGGGNSERTLADHSVYDPATDAWRDAAPLPRAQGSVAAVVFHNRIYAIGGRSGFSDFGDTFVYDEAADHWTKGPAIPPRGTGGAAVFRNTIWYVGGESQAKSAVLGDVYRLTRGTWHRAGRLPTARNYARAVVFKGALYAIGGSRSAGASHSAGGSRVVERYR
jgi:N-acetylneuraminic acid mutarotase